MQGSACHLSLHVLVLNSKTCKVYEENDYVQMGYYLFNSLLCREHIFTGFDICGWALKVSISPLYMDFK